MPSESAYTLVYEPNSAEKPSVNEFRNFLEKGDDETKIQAMRQIIISVINGDPMPDLLMTIIRYVMPSRNKRLKKLLYFYWEVCPKYDADGSLRHEMILVCNAIQHDLQHPNEYIRGNTLRFLNKLKEPELLEPLVPSCRQCLEHRHAYVRKNAVFAIYSIFKASEHLVPDVAELLADFLAVESDATCRRNAFVCLSHLDRDSCLRYIQDHAIGTLDPMLQLAFIQFIRKDAPGAPELHPQYLHIISELLESPNASVVYESATTLPMLSHSPTAAHAAASKFVDMAVKEPDNNVKLIALDRLGELVDDNEGTLDDMALDILRVLSAQSLDVRQKALDIAMELVSSKNVDGVVKLLKKELQKTTNSNEDKSAEYRRMLIVAIRQCATHFEEVAANVVDLLLEQMADLNTVGATEVVTFVKQVIEKYPGLRSGILSLLLESLKSIKSGKVYRGCLWIIGEYCTDEQDVRSAWTQLRASLGEIPIVKQEDEDDESSDEPAADGQPKAKGPKILADGTYATESAIGTEEEAVQKKKAKTPKTPLRNLILQGDFYLAAVLSSTLVKIVLRLSEISDKPDMVNALKAEAMLIMVSLMRAGQSPLAKRKIDEDSQERLMSCVRLLADANQGDVHIATDAFLKDTKEAFEHQIAVENAKATALKAATVKTTTEQPDEAISFRQLEVKEKTATVDITEFELSQISGGSTQREDLTSRLKKIVQLTGFSDPVYAEAYVRVHQFDVTLDVLLVNQTKETLRNLTVEFATLGDLKVVDKPDTANVAAHSFHRVQTTIKVTSADTGVIFGNIIYDGHHGDESNVVILSDVHVDILDYIKPATCSEAQFRKMWNEFEWENKISVNSSMSSLKAYLDELLAGTNMNNLTPGAVIGPECQFLSANLYSRSTFGEDALANLCIEKSSSGPIIGHVRIRSKGQGLALSLGDKVAAIARNTNKAQVLKV